MTEQTAERLAGIWREPQLILWDWNGTLLDDVDYAIGVRNRVFPRFGLKPIQDIAEYHAQFTFPVKLYYTRAGVTEENFNEVAHAWMDEYVRGCADVPLFGDAVAAIDAFARAGMKQAVLSASKLETLNMQLRLAGIRERFDDVLGLSHIFATSKVEIGRTYLAENGVNPKECVMLGDTQHDAEVADRVGCRCVLIARGHQSRQTLESIGVPVRDTLTDAVDFILGRKTPNS